MKSYQLQYLLGEELKGPAGHYRFIGGDMTLIKDILKFGYRHLSVSGIDLHKIIFEYHLALVFQLR